VVSIDEVEALRTEGTALSVLKVVSGCRCLIVGNHELRFYCMQLVEATASAEPHC
jgi:hypothetical protein